MKNYLTNCLILIIIQNLQKQLTLLIIVMFKSKLNLKKYSSTNFIERITSFFCQTKKQTYISPNEPSSSIIKKYKQNQGSFYNNKSLFQWFKDTIRQSANGNNKKFQDLIKVTSFIHISKYDSWKSLHQISFQLKSLFNQRVARPTKQIKIIELLRLANNFNYEFDSKQDVKFISQLREKVKIRNRKEIWDYSPYFQICLRQNKVVNLIQGKQLQNCLKKLLIKQNVSKNQEFIISNIIKEGLISQTWSDSFLQQVLNIIQTSKKHQTMYQSLRNAIKFTKYQLFQTQIQFYEKGQQRVGSETEQQIGNIFQQLDYNVTIGAKIFNYQIDYMIGDKIIVQFHGIHHYTTNSYKTVQTLKSSWKTKNLQNRCFKVLVIPFYQWKQLKNIKQKKQFIITEFQNFVLSNSSTNKNTQ